MFTKDQIAKLNAELLPYGYKVTKIRKPKNNTDDYGLLGPEGYKQFKEWVPVTPWGRKTRNLVMKRAREFHKLSQSTRDFIRGVR